VPWPEINAALRRLIRDGAHGSWFNRVGFHGITDGVISLSTPTGVAADRINRDYAEAIKQAAESVGVFVERVLISVRKR
jgi:chromosomal replication initiation ATPase DnaA